MSVTDFKRLIGRRFSDEIVKTNMKLWPFNVLLGKDDKPMICISYKGEVKQFTPEQISSMVLVKMKDTTEAYIGMKVKNVVITVPAYFNNNQRQATIQAGTIAGLNVMRIINEPTAAAIAYGNQEQASYCDDKSRNILIFHLGGGTFDVSLVTVAKESFEVKATCGDTQLGGVDFDNNVVNHFVQEFKKQHFIDIEGNHRALERLRLVCEKAKKSLSALNEITIEVDCLSGDVDFSSTLSRDQFEVLNTCLFEKCKKAVQICLQDAKMNKSDVHDVVLVGGSTRIPKVQQLLQKFFDGRKLYKSLHPDEAAAFGAAIQAAILIGIRHNQHIVDINSLPLSAKKTYGELGVVMNRHTPIPKKMIRRYKILFDSQKSMTLNVYEGQTINNTENYLLGTFILDGIPMVAISDSHVDATFEIDSNGILTLTSVVESPHRKWTLTITEHSGKLSEKEIISMVKEAKKYEMNDMNHMKLRNSRFEVEKFVGNMSKSLSKYDDKSENRKKLEDVISETNQYWLDSNVHLNDASKFQDKLKELKDICVTLLGASWVEMASSNTPLMDVAKPKSIFFFLNY